MTPTVTIILTSHMKPTLKDAIASIGRQTRQDFQVVIMDSGQWRGKDDEISLKMRDIHGTVQLVALLGDAPLIWEFTDEEPGLADRLCPVGWATNEAIRRGLVRGKYVCTFFDDDEYEPTFLERMVGHLEDTGEQAVWCTQDRVALLPSGERQHRGVIRADRVLTPGDILDRVDGGQVVFTREAMMSLGDPWLTEDRGQCYHSDGLFLVRLCERIGEIKPLDEMLYTHRFTPYSTYSPT